MLFVCGSLTAILTGRESCSAASLDLLNGMSRLDYGNNVASVWEKRQPYYLVSTHMRSLVDADHVISSFIHHFLQLPGKLVANSAAASVTTHVGANEEAQAFESSSTALQVLASDSIMMG